MLVLEYVTKPICVFHGSYHAVVTELGRAGGSYTSPWVESVQERGSGRLCDCGGGGSGRVEAIGG